MATIKSHTSVEQSRKLAEILPHESADMYYKYVLPKSNIIEHNPQNGSPVEALKWYNKGYTYSDRKPLSLEEYCIPCWSLAALLDVLPTKLKIVLAINDFQGDRKEKYVIGSVEHDKYDCYADNPVDACVNMIIKLHECKKL